MTLEATHKKMAGSLLALFLMAQFLPAGAESMWIPRLGYPATGSKRIYLDVPAEDAQKAESKADRHEDKATQKARKVADKAQRSEAKEKAQEAKQLARAEKHKDIDVKTTPTPEKLTSEQSKAAHEAQKEAYRIKADKARAMRLKARLEVQQAKQESVHVDGDYFLYDVKQGRMMFKESPRVEAVTGTPTVTPAAPYYVDFADAGIGNGLYDLAIRGSGHRSEEPLWVSDSLYWDALKPVVADINKTHCSLTGGRFEILHQCYFLQTVDKAAYGGADVPVHTVQGGWYTDNDALQSIGILKDTSEIASITQMLVRLYNVNPKSFKYITFSGESYVQSRFPDILDEANWGLKYLTSLQLDNGGFPAGIQRNTVDEKDPSWLLPATPQATARAIMALGNASVAFQPEDLSQSVKYLRTAEKGWKYLRAQRTPVDPELMLMASSALMQASDKAEYAEAYAQARASVTSLSPQTAILLGDTTLPVNSELPADLNARQVSAALPLLVQVQDKVPGANTELAAWLDNLYGYEKVALVRDPHLELVSAWIDPLQWMATKTGEVAIRLGHQLSDGGVLHESANVNSEVLKAQEAQETKAKARSEAGYRKLNLRTLDKAYLAYALVLMNQEVAPTYNPTETKSVARKHHTYDDNPGGVKSYYPDPLGGRQPYMK